jgi:hypothetical protein
MVDQIIDRRTVFLPGPQGDPGPQGPVNPDSAPTDEALGEWIGSSSTQTHAALKAWIDAVRPPMSIADYGVPVDSESDVSGLIQAIIDDGHSIYIPNGVYHLDSPLIFPDNTESDVTLELAANAALVANEEMDSLVQMGDGSTSGNKAKAMSVIGGRFEGQSLAHDNVFVHRSIHDSVISRVISNNAVDSAFHIDAISGSYSQNAQISDIRINLRDVDNAATAPHTRYGIYYAGADEQLSNMYARRVDTAIHAEGYLQATNVHAFNTIDPAQPERTVFLEALHGFNGGDLYSDSFAVAVSQLKLDGSYDSSPIFISNLNAFSYSAFGAGTISSVLDINQASSLLISGLRISYKDYTTNFRVLRLHDSAGECSYASNNKTIIPISNLQNPALSRMDMVNSAIYTADYQATLFDAHDFAKGEGVCIGLIPGRRPGETGTLSPSNSVMFWSQKGQAGSYGWIDIALDITDTDSVTLSVKAPNPYNASGNFAPGDNGGIRTKSNQMLYFGVKAPITDDNGAKYYPLYLFNADSPAGLMNPTYIMAHKNIRPIIWKYSQTIETGLTAGSFIATSKK